MRHVVAFGRFWYDFVVGEDWRIAAAVAVLVAVAAVIVSTGSVSTTTLAVAVALGTTALAALGTTFSGLRLLRTRPPTSGR
jgi:hypothetical protein